MIILRRHKKAAAKSAQGRHQVSSDARGTLSTFGGSLLALESRIMFDGAAMATVSTVTTEQVAQSQAEASFSGDNATPGDSVPAAPTGEPQPTAGDQALFEALAAYDSAARQEILFLSPSVQEYQQLLDGISPHVEVIMLDPARDGVEQMAEALAGRTDIDAIHIISHGAQAELTLGTARLTLDSMNGVYANELAVIGQSLSEKADLLIYGCNFGQGESGAEAAMRLGQLTGADVAASADATGHASLGGDWDLEHTVGPIETSQAFTMDVQQNWSHLMPTETVLDNFSSASYGNNNGTQSWSTSWVESDNGGGGAGGGRILVTGGELFIDAGLGTVGNNIYREVDLTGALSATLSYSYTSSLGIGGAIEVQISNNGGASYTTLETYNSLLPASGTGSFDITSYISANTRVRFEVTGALLLNTIQFDNVRISYVTNDPPIITNLSGDSLSYNEGDGAIVIEQGGNVTVSDANSLNFDTGALTVSFTAGSDAAEDVLAIRNQGSGAGQIGVSGSNITYGGVTIGTVSGGSGGTNLVVSFNSAATPAAAQALIQNITYENTDTSAPTTGARTVRYFLTDGDGGNSGNHDTTVTVSGVNDAPVGTPTITGTVTEDQTLTADTSGITDADGLGVFGYQWLRNGVAVGGATASTYLLGDADVGMQMSVRVSYTDAQGTAEGPLTSAQTAAVANVNDAPVITSNGGGATASISVQENTVAVTTATSTDLDGGVPTYSIVGGVDAARFSITGGGGVLQFIVAPDFEAPADVGANNTYVVTIQVDDGNGGTDMQTLTITIADVAEGVPPITSPLSIPPSLLPHTLPPPIGASPAAESPLPPAPIVMSALIPSPWIPIATALPSNSPGDSVPPAYEAPAASVHGDGQSTGPSLPIARELQEYLQEKIAPLAQRAIEDVQNAFDEQNLAEAPARISAAFRSQLRALEEDLQRAMDNSESQQRLTVHILMVGGATLTAGFNAWLLRSGALLASLASTLPPWRHFDPLPVVLYEGKQFHGLGNLLDDGGERPGQEGKASAS